MAQPSLHSSPAFCAVKICGVTQREQALRIAELGADFIGVNFWPGSKRYLNLDKAVEWMAEVPSPTRLVGVFVNPDNGSPEFCASVMKRGVRVLKAIQVRNEASLDAIADYPVQDILLDAYHPQERGGIGAKFPWELAVMFKSRYPEKKLWLAGGLTAENVGEAVRGVQPHAVDVASGVESGASGVKDLGKVARFVREAKNFPEAS
jgi:phosphoribosylanthranilate isomerase